MIITDSLFVEIVSYCPYSINILTNQILKIYIKIGRLNYSITARVEDKRNICFQIPLRRFFSNVIALIPERITKDRRRFYCLDFW